MPSSLPVVPGHRFAYDTDGSYVSRSGLNGSGAFSALDASLLNDEDDDYVEFYGYRAYTYWNEIAVTFPEPRDITGYYARTGINPNGNSRVYTSTDTTDGSNGNWTNQTQFIYTGGPLYGNGSLNPILPDARSAIQAVNFPGVKGIRFRMYTSDDGYIGRIHNLHIYGYTSPAASIERVEFWDPTLDQQVTKDQLDFGDTPQGQFFTKPVRIKNLSATKTAGSIVLSATPSPGGNTVLASGIGFSADNATFTPTLNIGTLAPGAISPVIYVRRTVGATDPALVRFARVLATPTTFA